jgi:hypothetical protein
MRLLILLIIVTAAAAYLTRPDEADAEARLRKEVMVAVATRELGEGGSTGDKLALAACKLAPGDCYDLLRSAMELTVTDRVLFTQVVLTGFEKRATCYGLFTTFVCPGGFKDDGG